MLESTKAYDELLLDDAKPNPFPDPPAATSISNRPALFMIGRNTESNKIRELIATVAKTGDPKIIFISGSQGVGKSTLVSYTTQEFKKKEANIIVSAFDLTADKNDVTFKSLYASLIDQFHRQQLIPELSYKLIMKILLLLFEQKDINREELLKELNITINEYSELSKEPSNLKNIIKRYPEFIDKIYKIFQQNFNYLGASLPVNNFDLFNVIWHAVGADNRVFDALKALMGKTKFDTFEITREQEAKITLQDIFSLFKWCVDVKTIIITFDHLEAGITNAKEVYNAFYSLLLQLRQFQNVLIILSGNLDAYNTIDQSLGEDMNGQIQNWALNNVITLNPLNEQESSGVFKGYLERFWHIYGLLGLRINEYYPFGQKSLEYLYVMNNKDLRRSLETLYQEIKTMRKEKRIKQINSLYDGFKAFRNKNNYELTTREQYILRNEVLDPQIQDKERSRDVEVAIKATLDKVQLIYLTITNIKHEPIIEVKSGKYKPDIYFEVNQTGGLSEVKRIGIEVKVYRKGKEIPKDQLEKTHVLIEQGGLDYIYWITDVPLSIEKFKLHKDLYQRVGRQEPLNDEEMGYIGLLCHKNEIFENSLAPEIEKELLKKAGIDLTKILDDVKILEKITDKDLIKSKKPTGLLSVLRSFKEIGKEKEIEEEIVPQKVGTPALQEELNKEATQVVEKDELEELIIRRIDELLKNKAFVNKSTIIKEVEKTDEKEISLRFQTNDEFSNYIHKVAIRKGYKVTTTRIYPK